MRITIASVPTDSRAQNYYKTKRRRKSRIRGKAAKRKYIFSKNMACACAGGIYTRTRAARGARVFIKLAEKREMRKNESGEYAGNRSGECAVARESKRNDWTDKHMEGWLRNG